MGCPHLKKKKKKKKKKEISTGNMQKSTNFSIEIGTICREMMKFPGIDKFLDLDRDF